MKSLQKAWGWYSALPKNNKIGFWLLATPTALLLVSMVIPERQPTCSEVWAQSDRSPVSFREFGKQAAREMECIEKQQYRKPRATNNP
jgi:hypothetical protein